MRLSRRAWIGALLGLSVTACISPTLPLPPPSPPDIERVGEGQYRLQGSIPVQGTVLVLNTRTSLVHGQVASVLYDFVVPARPRDTLVLWYVSGAEESDTVEFEIPGGTVSDGGVDAPESGAPATPSDAGTD